MARIRLSLVAAAIVLAGFASPGVAQQPSDDANQEYMAAMERMQEQMKKCMGS